jgi:hypothetical protein
MSKVLFSNTDVSAARYSDGPLKTTVTVKFEGSDEPRMQCPNSRRA